jgi:hypothetical protein
MTKGSKWIQPRGEGENCSGTSGGGGVPTAKDVPSLFNVFYSPCVFGLRGVRMCNCASYKRI